MFGLPEETMELIKDYFVKVPEVSKVVIYGSRAKGDHEKGSDIDLAVFSTSEKELAGRLKTELEELPTPYFFDVTDYSRLKHKELKGHIDRVGKVFYEKK